VSRLFVFILFQVNLLQADGIMAKNKYCSLTRPIFIVPFCA
jgi:hypothetical protein